MLRLGPRSRAFALVTALAIGAGAALGLLVVGAAIGFGVASGRSITGRDVVGLFVLGALWGGVFGLALGPLTAFGLLRAVPLWRAVLGTGAGTVLGVAATFVLGVNPFLAIPIGFVAGALAIRALHGRRAIAATTSDSGPPPPPHPL